MKKLKLDHDQAQAVLAGRQHSTWRVFDDKDLAVNDMVDLVDKADPAAPQTWRVIGRARISQIIEKRLGEIIAADYEDPDSPLAQEAPHERLARYQGYYGESVSLNSPVKMVRFEFDPAAGDTANATGTVARQQPAPPISQRVILYTDGGSRGNPGPSASGYIIMDETENVLVDKGIYLGITTNNQAEYQALKSGLEEARRMGAQEVEVRMDSLLVVNQMKGVFKVSNRELWPVHDAIKQLAAQFRRVSYSHVPRELNKLADDAVNRVLDEAAAQASVGSDGTKLGDQAQG